MILSESVENAWNIAVLWLWIVCGLFLVSAKLLEMSGENSGSFVSFYDKGSDRGDWSREWGFC